MDNSDYKTTLTDGTELVLSRTEQSVQIRQTTGMLTPGVVSLHAENLDELGLAISDLWHNNKDW